MKGEVVDVETEVALEIELGNNFWVDLKFEFGDLSWYNSVPGALGGGGIIGRSAYASIALHKQVLMIFYFVHFSC